MGQTFAVEVGLALAEKAVPDLSAGSRHVLAAEGVPCPAPELVQALAVEVELALTAGAGEAVAAEAEPSLAVVLCDVASHCQLPFCHKNIFEQQPLTMK